MTETVINRNGQKWDVVKCPDGTIGYVYAPYIPVTIGLLLEDKSGKYYTDYKTKKTSVIRGSRQKSIWVAMRLMKKPHSDLYKAYSKKINPTYYGTIKINNL